MQDKIKKYSWIHQLNNEILKNKMLNEAKRYTESVEEYLTEESFDPEGRFSPDTKKRYEEMRAKKAKEKLAASNKKKPIKNRKVKEPELEGNFSFPTDVRDAHDFADDLINQHREYEGSTNPLDIKNHQELMSQFIQHTRSNANLEQAGNKVKDYMGRYNLSRSRSEESRRKANLADPAKADAFYADLGNKMDAELNRMRASGGRPGTMQDLYRVISGLGGSY